MVPSGWSEGRVKDLVKSLDAGVSVNSEDDGYTESRYKILKTSSVSKGIFDYSKTKSVTESSEVSRLKEPVLADTIIISRMNTPTLVGANGYITYAIKDTFLPDRLWQAKPKDKSVNMRWLGYWFSSGHTRYALSAMATGTSGSMKNITKPDVLNIRIEIPPLPEQKKIAKILSTWDKAISTTEALINNSKQQKKALMQQLLTGKKRFAGFEYEWNNLPLRDVVSIFYGKSPKDIFSDNGCFNVIGTGGMTGFTHIHLCDEPAVIIGRKGTIDKPQLIDKPFWAIDTTFYCLPANQQIDIKWFYYLAKSLNLRSYNEASGVPSLSRETLYGIRVSVPRLVEQHKISSVLSAVHIEIELLEQQLTDLKQEKKALMQQLLTGKRRVKVDEIEAAMT